MPRFVLIVFFFAQVTQFSFASGRVTIEQLNKVVTSALPLQLMLNAVVDDHYSLTGPD